jgi:dienelactone hydrolase
MRALRILAGALLLLTGCSYAHGGRGMLPVGAGDVVDTWKHRVTVEPSGVSGPVPVVLFIHGCNGLGTLPGILYPDTRAWVQTVTQAGWRFVAPDSWARGTWNRPDGCTADIETERAVRLLRLEEIAYAVRQLAADSTVDQKRIVLLGHSEGGLAVATAAPPKTVAGIIISGWMCHSSVPLGVGIAAPPNIPVLAIAFEHDSFIAHSTHNTIPPGRCSAFFPGRHHATELIIPGEGHTTGTRAEASQAVVKFLGGLR